MLKEGEGEVGEKPLLKGGRERCTVANTLLANEKDLSINLTYT